MAQLNTGNIYVVQFGEHVKIGYSVNLRQRMHTLRYGPDGAVGVGVLCLSMPATLTDERRLHRRLTRYRVYDTNEWYTSDVLNAPEVLSAGFTAEEPEHAKFPCPHCSGLLTVTEVKSLYRQVARTKRAPAAPKPAVPTAGVDIRVCRVCGYEWASRAGKLAKRCPSAGCRSMKWQDGARPVNAMEPVPVNPRLRDQYRESMMADKPERTLIPIEEM